LPWPSTRVSGSIVIVRVLLSRGVMAVALLVPLLWRSS
jgi:hypothetical protein